MPLYLNTYSLQFRIPQGRFPQPQMAALLTTPNKGTLAWPRIGLMSIRLEKWTLRAEVVSFYLILGTHACSNLEWYFVGSSTPWHWTICHQTTLSVTPSSPNTNSVSCLSGLHLKTSCCEDCRHKWYFHLSSNYYLGVFSTSSTLLMWISCPTSQNLLLSKPPVLSGNTTPLSLTTVCPVGGLCQKHVRKGLWGTEHQGDCKHHWQGPLALLLGGKIYLSCTSNTSTHSIIDWGSDVSNP